jgi:hypothetical protein
METSRQPSSIPPANPPSVEIAYKRKCIALKKRLAEVEAENEIMRTRNRRGSQYIQKMRLETCMLLERLTKVTGMADEAKTGAANPELRARAAAMMNPAQGGPGLHLEDDTEGSSDEQPRTVRVYTIHHLTWTGPLLPNLYYPPLSLNWSVCLHGPS